MFPYFIPQINHFLNWELLKYDSTETFNPFSSQFNRMICTSMVQSS
ncbi:unnamed protein product [Paramecium sonneborni]|uniref:Uncharacterized protein n=1 Tax=Paramecium sonneborni TaxID=65129 RepID=A0A8S1R2C2_9CILI|nr:unnamed protein product [Paramecium sonneborni]